MPLVEFVGFTCTGKNFNIAFAFLSNENDGSYTWALNQLAYIYGENAPEVIMTDRELGLINAIKVVYPNVNHMLCWVHILRKCQEKALKLTGNLETANKFMYECRGLLESRSVDSYERRRRGLWARWSHVVDLMPYLDITWLNKHKEKMVRAWTDTAHHFGTRSTNRVESAHWVLKRTLQSSVGDFGCVFQAIDLDMVDQIREVRGSIERNRNTWATDIDGMGIFSRVQHIVSKDCFEHLYKLYEKVIASAPEPECTD